MTRKSLYATLSLLAAAILSGCAETNIKSARSPDYNRMPQRLFVVASLGNPFVDSLFHKYQTDFAEDFRQDLQSCNVTADVTFTEFTALHIATDEKIQNFKPDAVLSIQWTKINTLGRAFLGGIYHLDLKDQSSGVIVWDANVDFAMNGQGGFTDPGEILIHSVVNRMVADTVLPKGCFIPEK